MKTRSSHAQHPGFWLIVVIAIIGGVSCGSNNQSTSQKRMFVSSKEFDQGRTDGNRDAKISWTEDSAAWMWIWMKDNQYKQGYEQGWREGRTQIKFEAERSEAESMQE